MLQVDDYILKRLKRLVHKRKVGVDEDLLLLHLLRKETVPDEQRHGKIEPRGKDDQHCKDGKDPPKNAAMPDSCRLLHCTCSFLPVTIL